jgi:hypothetical protein
MRDLVVLGAPLAAVALGFVVAGRAHHALQNAVLAFAAVAGFAALDRDRPGRAPLAWGLLLAAAGIGVARSAGQLLENVRSPHEWDILCWHLYARTALEGHSVYDPQALLAVMREIPVPFVPSKNFVDMAVLVPFRYPPPTLLLFLPLGALDFDAANRVWQFVVGASGALAILATAALLLPSPRLPGLLAVTGLLLALPPARWNLYSGQTNFFMLLAALGTIAFRGPWLRGASAVFGMVVKPFGAALAVPFLGRRDLRALGACLLWGLASLALAEAILGAGTLRAYVFENPVAQLSREWLASPFNVSMIAAILRHLDPPVLHALPYWAHPLHVLAAGAVVAALALVLLRRRAAGEPVALAATLGAALLLYPQVLLHYAVVLIVPVVLLLRHRDAIGLGDRGAAVAAAVLYAALQPAPLLATAAVFAATVVLAGRLAATRATAPAAAPGAALPRPAR